MYPLDVVDALANSSALYAAENPFDVAAGWDVMKSFTDLTGTMLHARKMKGGDGGSTFDAADVADLLERNKEAVFFHGHDESLPLVLMGRTPPPKPRNDSATAVYPSFTEQTQWQSGLFTFPASFQPTVYYNPSIARIGKERFLFTRRQIFSVGLNSKGSTSKNDLAIFRIRQNMTLDPDVAIPQTPNRYTYEQWEDPRAMVGTDGRVYVSFATWVHGERWRVRQSLCRLSSAMDRFDVVEEPEYGGNSPHPQRATNNEKNWLWFQHEGQWSFLYSMKPHMLHDCGYTHIEVPIFPWKHGDPRGGTPPVLIGDLYWSFFHSSIPHEKYRRRYFMGAYAFSAKPPFRPMRITPKPILAGSEADFNDLNSPLVIFPNGALLENGVWTVVFGVNDEGSGWIKIPHEELEKVTVRC